MDQKLSSPPPKLWKAFTVIYWFLIASTALIVLFFVALLVILAIAVLAGWLASLVS